MEWVVLGALLGGWLRLWWLERPYRRAKGPWLDTMPDLLATMDALYVVKPPGAKRDSPREASDPLPGTGAPVG
jgi:hypothetical protein